MCIIPAMFIISSSINMKNNFTPETRSLFDLGGYMMDLEDGRNDADCLHHVLHRISDSPYNAVSLNNRRNHMPEGRRNIPSIHSMETQKKYLKKVKKFLENINYHPDEDDLLFLRTNRKLYV